MGSSAKNYMKQGAEVLVIGGSITPDTEVQAAHIADAEVAAGAAPTKTEYDALVGKFNDLLAAVENVGILAKS